MRRFRKISAQEIQADAPVDSSLLEKIKDNQTFFNSNASGMGYNLEDFSDKAQLLEKFSLAGSGEADGTAIAITTKPSASGAGVIQVTGANQNLTAVDLMPVNPYLGIGGYVVASASTSANLYAGIACYNEAGSYLGVKYFIADTFALGSSWSFKKGQLLGEGAGASQFPVGTRFVRTAIHPRNNTLFFYLDSVGIFPLNFATSALYS